MFFERSSLELPISYLQLAEKSSPAGVCEETAEESCFRIEAELMGDFRLVGGSG